MHKWRDKQCVAWAVLCVMAQATLTKLVLPLVNARTRDHERHPQYWDIMRPVFDESLKHTWEALSESGVQAVTFWRSHRAGLALFAADDDLAHIFAAEDKIAMAGEHIRRVASSSAIGASLFHTELLKVRRLQFQSHIVPKLKDLEHLEFDPVSLDGFHGARVERARPHGYETVRPSGDMPRLHGCESEDLHRQLER